MSASDRVAAGSKTDRPDSWAAALYMIGVVLLIAALLTVALQASDGTAGAVDLSTAATIGGGGLASLFVGRLFTLLTKIEANTRSR